MDKKAAEELLVSALRQYRHNNDDGLLFAFDYDEAIKVVNTLTAERDTLKVKLDKAMEWSEALEVRVNTETNHIKQLEESARTVVNVVSTDLHKGINMSNLYKATDRLSEVLNG